LGYSKNWNPAGNTYRIQHERLITSPYIDEDGLIKAVAGGPIPLESPRAVADVPFLDDTELDFADEESRRILRQHLICERSARLVQIFKAQLKDCSCCVCGFDFLKAYGESGRGYIEAHHTKPVAMMKPGEVVRIQDSVPVCSNLPSNASSEISYNRLEIIEGFDGKSLCGPTLVELQLKQLRPFRKRRSCLW
jgi:hypothetical protein